MIEAKVIADSTANEVRLTTLQLTYPRFIHSEFMTHRVFSRNASSSRAIPVAKMIEQVTNNPAMPIHWGKNQPGMQADEELDPTSGIGWWQGAVESAIYCAEELSDDGYHKQIVNRILEPFQHIKVVVTATEWDNFFALRDHHAAQPEIQELAKLMQAAMAESEPEVLGVGQWHLPYVPKYDEDGNPSYYDDPTNAIKCSAARCARVSYLNHDNSQPDIQKDLELFDMLATRPYEGRGMSLEADEPVHLSPLEHQATPMGNGSENSKFPRGVTHMDRDGNFWSGNFRGWIQYRQMESMK